MPQAPTGASIVTKRADLNHTRSEGDRKDYRLIQLENGLECLLISTFAETGFEMSKKFSSASSSVTPQHHTDRRISSFFDQPSRNIRVFSEDILASRISDVDEEGDEELLLDISSKRSMTPRNNNNAMNEDEELFPPSQFALPALRFSAATAAQRESSSKNSVVSLHSHAASATPRLSMTNNAVSVGAVSGEAGKRLSKFLPSSSSSSSSPSPAMQEPMMINRKRTSMFLSEATTPTNNNTNPATNSRPPTLKLSRAQHSDLMEEIEQHEQQQQQQVPPRSHRVSTSSRGSILFNHFQPRTLSHQEDTSVDTCAVAMGVKCGSFDTPPGLDGLAHFLEHMLFMGSTKHPKENEFDVLLSQCGGASNAYTDTEQTMFHFTAPQPHVKECLSCFAQFFVSPLLLPEACTRELNSIEAEFALRKNMDRCRLQEIWRETSVSGSAFSKFTCGNLETLSKDHAYPALCDFYQKHYVSPNMKFVIVSGEPLLELELGVCFQLKDCRPAPSVASPTTTPPPLLGFPWGDSCGGIYRMVPTVQDVHELQLTWQLSPELGREYRSKPCEYISQLLSHECAGSILCELKNRGWAHSVVAGVCQEDGFAHNRGVSLFNISLSLTNAGMSQWIFVVGVVMEYLGILKRQGVQQWIFEELQQITALRFRFKEEEKPHELVQTLCSDLLNSASWEDSVEILHRQHLLFEWRPDLIHSVLDSLLCVDTMRIDLLSSRLVKPGTSELDDIALLSQCERPHSRFPRKEEFTGAQFWEDPVPPPVLDTWKAIVEGNSTVGYISHKSVFPESLGLPPRNPYIASNFELKRRRMYDFSHVLVGAELKIGLSSLSLVKRLSQQAFRVGSASSALTTPPLRDFGVVVCFDKEQNAILVRYPAKEGVRKWHRFDATYAVVDFQKQRTLSVDGGKNHLQFTMIPKLMTFSSTRTISTQVDDFDFTFSPSDIHVWKKHFPKIPQEKPAFPTMVAGSDEVLSLWYLQELSFRSPRVHLFVSILTPNVSDSAMSAALADLFAMLVFDSLNQESYLAFLVDLNFDIEVISGMGIQLHFSGEFASSCVFKLTLTTGFSHKLLDLVKIVLRRTLFFTRQSNPPPPPPVVSRMPSAILSEKQQRKSSAAPTAASSSKRSVFSTTTEGDDDEFDSFVHYFLAPDQDAPLQFDTPLFFTKCETLLADYLNASSRFRSGKQVSSVMFDLLCTSLYTPLEKAQAMSGITPELFVDFVGQLFSTVKVEGLVEGNLDDADATMYYKCLRAALWAKNVRPVRTQPLLRSQTIPVVSTKNQAVSGLIHVLEAVESQSHSVELFFQVGVENPEDRVLLCILEQLMSEPLYAELRTKQQLGYNVKCGVRSVCGTIGFVVEITSNVHGPEQLAADVDEFFKTFRNTLKAMSVEEYIVHASSVGLRLLSRIKNLEENCQRHWDCILGHALFNLPYVWNVHLVDCALIRASATKARIVEVFDSWLDPNLGKRRRASVFVVGVQYARLVPLIKALNRPWVTFIGMIHHNEAHHAKQRLEEEAEEAARKLKSTKSGLCRVIM